MTWILLDVGCLECEEWSEVVSVHSDEDAAFAAFYAEAEAHRVPCVVPGLEGPQASAVPRSLVAAAGNGGSRFYPVQLHRV